MKFLILLFALFGISAAQYDPYYKPTYARNGVQERYANTLRNNYDLAPEGIYQYSFETDNGISQSQSGYPRTLSANPPVVAEQVTGRFSWVSPEGKLISISYVADENGYRPVGDALPNPPPVPAAILRAVEFNEYRAAQRFRDFK